MKTKTITLQLPSGDLSPNARVHWAVLAKAKKAYRKEAYLCALTCGVDNNLEFESYMLHFFFKDKRRRDRDNFTARMKSGLDGIADATPQDDSDWDFNGVRFAIDKTNPRVEVRCVIKED